MKTPVMRWKDVLGVGGGIKFRVNVKQAIQFYIYTTLSCVK